MVELAVVFLIVGTLLAFACTSFTGSATNLLYSKNVMAAQALAERTLLTENLEVPDGWQVQKLEHRVQSFTVTEVQVLDAKSGKVIFNLLVAK